jgi:YVTN family beta-propeller protein
MLYATPDGGHALVTDPAGDRVAMIDLMRARILWTVGVRGSPEGAAVTPDGQAAYAAGRASGDLTVLALGRTAARVTARFAVGPQPIRVAVSRDGREAYVTLFGAARLQVVDLRRRRIVASVGTGPRPVGVSLAPDGRTLWVGNLGAGVVTVIDSRTRRVVRTVAAGQGPDGIAFGPPTDGQRPSGGARRSHRSPSTRCAAARRPQRDVRRRAYTINAHDRNAACRLSLPTVNRWDSPAGPAPGENHETGRSGPVNSPGSVAQLGSLDAPCAMEAHVALSPAGDCVLHLPWELAVLW